MTDRNSAEDIFLLRTRAYKMWRMSQRYDFSNEQLDCDKCLVAIGLAREVPDPDCPGETMIIYGPEDE